MNKIKLHRFDGETIFIGIYFHLNSWKVSLHSREFELKAFTQPPDSVKLMKHLQQYYLGATYQFVYEIGFSGFSTQRQLNMKIECCEKI